MCLNSFFSLQIFFNLKMSRRTTVRCDPIKEIVKNGSKFVKTNTALG